METEVKLRVADAAAAREAVVRLGARPKRSRHLEDNVLYDSPDGRLARAGCALRIRVTEEGGVVTYKGPKTVRDGIRSREEIELRVDPAEHAPALLLALGYRPRFRYQKYREAWAGEGVEIVLDETPIGVFLEIEGEAEAIHEAARRLGYGPGDYLAESYAALFFAGGGTGDMVFGA